MFPLRALILLAPLVPLALGAYALRSARADAELQKRSAGDTLLAGYWGEPVELDLLNGGDRISRGVARLVLEPLLSEGADGELVPHLAQSWSSAQKTSIFFLTEADAAAAGKIVLDAKTTRWPEWGLMSSELDGVGIHLTIEHPWPDAAEEISKAFDPTGLARVSKIRVELSEPLARQYHEHYKESALEAGQIKRVWFDGESAYEISVAGDLPRFKEELEIYYQQAVGDKLVRLEVIRDDAGISEPSLTFDLATDRTWHDGEMFDAEDVLFTLASIRSLPNGHPLGHAFQSVRDIEIPTANRLVLTYREPSAWSLSAWAGVPILPAHYLGSPERELWPEEAQKLLPGTGPYRVLGSDDSGGLLLGAVGAGKEFTRVQLRPYQDLLGLRAALQLEQLDIYLPEPEELSSLTDEGEIEIRSAPTGTWTIGGWNLVDGPTVDRGTRRALSAAIDPATVITQVLHGSADPISSLFPKTLGEPPAMQQIKGDALAALASAGWKEKGEMLADKDGKPLALRIVTNSEDPVRLEVARALAERWRELGARVEILPKPWGEIVGEILPQRDYELILLGWESTSSWDISGFWHSSIAKNMGGNVLGFANPEVDVLLDQLTRTYTAEERNELAGQVQSQILAEAPCLLLYERRLPTAFLTPTTREKGADSLWEMLQGGGS